MISNKLKNNFNGQGPLFAGLAAPLAALIALAVLASQACWAGEKTTLSDLKSRRSPYHLKGPFFKELATQLSAKRPSPAAVLYLQSTDGQAVLDSEDLEAFGRLSRSKASIPSLRQLSASELYLSVRLVRDLRDGRLQVTADVPANLPGGISVEQSNDETTIQFAREHLLSIPARHCFHLDPKKSEKTFCTSFTGQTQRPLIETGSHLGKGWGKVIDKVVAVDFSENPGNLPAEFFARALPNYSDEDGTRKSQQDIKVVLETFIHETKILKLMAPAPYDSAQNSSQRGNPLGDAGLSGIVGIVDIQPLQMIFEVYDSELFGLDSFFGPHEKSLLCADFFNGLQQIHSLGLVHKDLKLENLLIRFGFPPRLGITDFGFTEVLGESDEIFLRKRAASGSPNYVAPEVLLQKWIGITREQKVENALKADVFSAALNVISLIRGTVPKFADSQLHLRAESVKEFLRHTEEKPTLNLLDLFAMKSLAVDPGLRDYGLSERFSPEQQADFWSVIAQNPYLFQNQDEKPRNAYERQALLESLEGFGLQPQGPAGQLAPGQFSLWASPYSELTPKHFELSITLVVPSSREQRTYVLTDLHPEFPRESLAIYLKALHLAGWIRWAPSANFEFGPDKDIQTSIWTSISNTAALHESRQPIRRQAQRPGGLRRIFSQIKERLNRP